MTREQIEARIESLAAKSNAIDEEFRRLEDEGGEDNRKKSVELAGDGIRIENEIARLEDSLKFDFIKISKKQAAKNRRVVREYWRDYLTDRNCMAWLVLDSDGDVWTTYEANGQSYLRLDGESRLIHSYGGFYRSYGQLPGKIALKDFITELGIAQYLEA
jgi:hypothetical protein